MKTLREAVIIHPQDAEGHIELLEKLVHHFAGCTVTQGQGYWVEPHTLTKTEFVNIYTVAVPWSGYNPTNQDTIRTLRTIADQARVAGGQKCQYLRLPTGEVELRT